MVSKNYVEELNILTDLMLKGENYFEIENYNNKYKVSIYKKAQEKVDLKVFEYDYELIIEGIKDTYVDALDKAVQVILGNEEFTVLKSKMKNKFSKINKELNGNYKIEIIPQNQISNGYEDEVLKGNMPKITYTVYLYKYDADIDYGDYENYYSLDTLQEVYEKLYEWVR